ncbi:uncharacterized protein LY89DRAFT_577032 [Mollisia scopiformis]|uniref:Spt20-like SEP domain-containing protein n=1 Tax=Mollisia scopiformis TaxID=149040 RepID=A0A194XQ21_MOLSC|nr:uncharacterized protein LY89DRAFT_577032 [Mollisia scopiformis]KUJ21842.1 hypothetical protein LY89DRAFT_577032 [Mollisia scopiformis]
MGSNGTGSRSANRIRRDAPPQLLGRGQRNSSVGLRSASIVGEVAMAQPAEPQPYVLTAEYILKKYRGHPPSLIIHLHPTHFRFDQQEGSFTYKSPMRMVLEHIRQRTVPHDLLEFMQDVQFYDGCMIVQIHDHKSIAPSQGPNRTATGPGKTVPFSVHNYNTFLTPSSYVPYPVQNIGTGKGKDAEVEDKIKTAEQKDKENMPAPNLPGDIQRNKSISPPRKPKVITVVLHPTPLSNHIDLAIKAGEAYASPEDRRGSRQEVNGGPLSATVPPTPTTGAPPTPQLNMAPPAKRVKRTKAELDISNVYGFESQVTLARTAELKLEPVANAAESAALLSSLAHPMHSEQPPAPKTRKRTVAEMAADEALAADQERFMLVLDERLASNTAGAPGGANPANGDGPAGVSFEPRFERFKTLENIRANHEENKRQEKLRREEAERKQRVEQERNKLEENNKRAAEEKNRATAAAMQQAQQQQQLQQEAQRRRLAQQAQQTHQSMPTQIQAPHAHPQANGIVANGMNAQPQRFHQQQVSQAQTSSPIVRNGTPHSHSSPNVNNMSNAPMQHSTSSMGGSPPRPGSVVQQNHHPMGAPASQGMAPQRSQQSHAGTPRMPSSTPNVQVSTPLNRQMSQTPRMSQGSPLQGPMGQTPQVPMMNGQPMQMSAQQMQVLQQQRMQQMLRNQAAAAQGMGGMLNTGHPMTQQQMMQAQAQAMRAQQLNQQLGQGNPMAQQYAARLAQMNQATGMPQNMNQNFMNVNSNPQANMQQMQRLQQMQMIQQQAAQQAQQQQLHQQQQQAQQQQQQQHPDQQTMMREQMMQRQIAQMANQLYVSQRQGMAAQYPGGLPPDVDQSLKQRCSAAARQQFEASYRARQQMAVAQRMNGMQNGGGM